MVCRCCVECETDEDCPDRCEAGWEPTPKFDEDGNIIEGVGGCCSPGFPFDLATRLCGDSSSPSPSFPSYCCDGECQAEECPP
jgi:hypothetical protein